MWNEKRPYSKSPGPLKGKGQVEEEKLTRSLRKNAIEKGKMILWK